MFKYVLNGSLVSGCQFVDPPTERWFNIIAISFGIKYGCLAPSMIHKMFRQLYMWPKEARFRACLRI